MNALILWCCLLIPPTDKPIENYEPPINLTPDYSKITNEQLRELLELMAMQKLLEEQWENLGKDKNRDPNF